jgi:phage baseplate assembly protein W
MAKAFSIEDGNLGSASLLTAKTRLFKDIDLTFTAKPSGEIYKKQDAAAVKQALKNLILTNKLEKPFLPNFGGNLRAMLFELADDVTSFLMKDRIIKQIEAFEPRAKILKLDINMTPENNSLNVYLEARVLNASQNIISVETTITRYR